VLAADLVSVWIAALLLALGSLLNLGASWVIERWRDLRERKLRTEQREADRAAREEERAAANRSAREAFEFETLRTVHRVAADLFQEALWLSSYHMLVAQNEDPSEGGPYAPHAMAFSRLGYELMVQQTLVPIWVREAMEAVHAAAKREMIPGEASFKALERDGTRPRLSSGG